MKLGGYDVTISRKHFTKKLKLLSYELNNVCQANIILMTLTYMVGEFIHLIKYIHNLVNPFQNLRGKDLK